MLSFVNRGKSAHRSPVTGAREPYTQRRGEERRRRLIASAALLLADRDIDELSLDAVARHAGIPLTSVYHFYGDLHTLLAALAVHYGEGFVEMLARPLPAAKIATWEDVLAIMIARGVRYYRANPGARKLLIGGKAPADIKLADRLHDKDIGALLEATLARHFELPEFAERTVVCYHVVEIVDLLLQLSVIQFGRITPQMVRHARLACVGYLRAFLPAKLPLRRAAAVRAK
jgi:AcrR family transcriptional regulator